MGYFYSPSNDAFYPEDFKKEYQAGKSWPDDAVKTSDNTFKEFSTSVQGKSRLWINGELTWINKSPTIEEQSQQEVYWRNSELARADIELYKVQDADPKAKGSVSQWRSYRKDLRQWTEHKNFPLQEFRPKAPDA
jgi:hypothetical protein